ncbi:MAG: hypothetical protein R2779_04920 [Crocinitomicaceae bacterium]
METIYLVLPFVVEDRTDQLRFHFKESHQAGKFEIGMHVINAF